MVYCYFIVYFVILLCIHFVLRFRSYARPHKLHSIIIIVLKIKAVCLNNGYSLCLSVQMSAIQSDPRNFAWSPCELNGRVAFILELSNAKVAYGGRLPRNMGAGTADPKAKQLEHLRACTTRNPATGIGS